jgi:protein SCO1/2
MKCWAAIASLLLPGVLAAQPLALPAAPDAKLEQHPGARLPLELPAIDEAGHARKLADFFDGRRPVLLVPGYYRCPQLCGLVMHGLIDALQASRVDRSQWRIVRFSIDPSETPADARARRDAEAGYAQFAFGLHAPDALDLHLLTLREGDARRLADDIGYRYGPLRDANAGAGEGAYAHPASVVVVTPHGTVSRYFNGLQFDAAELRVALADAAGDRVGGVTSRLALLCAHFDPHVGRHTASVMDAVRAVSLALVAALAAWCWRRRGVGGAR